MKETKPRLDCFHKVVDDIIDIEHIDFVIPEYLPKSQSLAYQFSKFFAPRPCFMKSSNYILVHSCVILDFYKTRGRVFSNKGRMMRNGSGECLYMLFMSLYVFRLERIKIICLCFICGASSLLLK